MSKNSFAGGIVAGDSLEGPLYRKALLCRTGNWMGMNGEVTVTKDMLQRLADTYNAERASAINQNDYAPILINHDRDVNNVLGRLDISQNKLSVDPIPTDSGEYGLYGDIRIDEDYAKACVASGKYAQLSLSFDDESNEIYELSFVAVEAARRSQVLSKGDKPMKKKNTVALAMINQVIGKNKEVNLKMVEGVASATGSITALKAQIAEVQTKVKASSLKSLCHGLIREGKMSKAEFKKLDLIKLAALDTAALEAVTSAYTSRRPSADLVQYGEQGAKAVHTQVDSKTFKQLAAQQLKNSKSAKNLSEGDDADKDKDKDKDKDQNLAGDQSEDSSMDMADVKDIQAVLSKCLEGIKTITDSVEAFKAYASQLQVDDKKEEELASGDDEESEDDADKEKDKDKNNNGEGKGE